MELLDALLTQAGFGTMRVGDEGGAIQLIWRHTPSLVLIDQKHCGGDGTDLCRRLRGDRRSSRMPLILLSTGCDEADRVLGLEFGADDFIEMPFGRREFIARIRALLRRSNPAPSEILMHRDLFIDAGSCRVEFRGSAVPLTPTEFRVLRFLAQSPGRVHSREQIMEAVHHESLDAMDRSVDPHINAIRRKMGAGDELIETVRGFGYRLN
jgi:DNA-binding response OmpR family regulator